MFNQMNLSVKSVCQKVESLKFNIVVEDEFIQVNGLVKVRDEIVFVVVFNYFIEFIPYFVYIFIFLSVIEIVDLVYVDLFPIFNIFVV